MTSANKSSLSFWILFVAMALLATPFAVTLTDIIDGPDDRRSESEAKTPDVSPNFQSLKQFPGDFRHYIKQRYGLRNFFIKANSFATMQLFHAPPYDKVSIGTGKFLFLSDGEVSKYQQAAEPFSDAQKTDWAASIAYIASAVENIGAEYLFVVAPNKHTVYSEMAPRWITHRDSAFTRADQILPMLTKANVNALDLRPVLNSARTERAPRLYHYTDSHWNEYGAAIASRAIQKQLNRDDSGTLTADILQSTKGGDLARMIGLENRLKENIVVVRHGTPLTCTTDTNESYVHTHLDPLRYARIDCRQDGASDETALIFMDSFGVALIPGLARRYAHSIFVWRYEIDFALIHETKPDIVIQEMVERKFQALTPQDLNAASVDSCTVEVGGDDAVEARTALIIGNSIAHDHAWRIADMRVLNCASRGLTLEQFMARGGVDTINSAVDFVMIEFGTVEAVRAGTEMAFDAYKYKAEYSKLLAQVESKWSNAKILAVSAPPLSVAGVHSAAVSPAVITSANTIMADVAAAKSVQFLELGAILGEGTTYDGIHITNNAYRRWESAVAQVINKQKSGARPVAVE